MGNIQTPKRGNEGGLIGIASLRSVCRGGGRGQSGGLSQLDPVLLGGTRAKGQLLGLPAAQRQVRFSLQHARVNSGAAQKEYNEVLPYGCKGPPMSHWIPAADMSASVDACIVSQR